MRAAAGGPVGWVLAVVLATLRGAAAEPPELRLPADRIYDKAAGSPGTVRFSHRTHVPLADGRCVGCHPVPFRMLRPIGALTHRKMNAGRQCGICHDGKTASSVRDDCGHCHGTGAGS
jgi:c(7)-type cytochrome triheme protein